MKTREPPTIALRDLITMCADAAAGLRWVAAHVHHEDVREILIAESHRRMACAEELRLLVEERGDFSPPGGSTVGTIHRAWMCIRLALQADDPASLAECLRGERAAIERFEGDLAYLDDAAREVVARQLECMKMFHEVLANLEAETLLDHQIEVRRESLVKAHALDLHEEHRPG